MRYLFIALLLIGCTDKVEIKDGIDYSKKPAAIKHCLKLKKEERWDLKEAKEYCTEMWRGYVGML